MKTAWSKINYKPNTARAFKEHKKAIDKALKAQENLLATNRKHRRLQRVLSDLAFRTYEDFKESYQEARSLIRDLKITQKGMKSVCIEPARIAAVMRS